MNSAADFEKLSRSSNVAEFISFWLEFRFPKLSLENIARKCRVSSKSTIHDVLSGRRRASLNLLISICSGLKIAGPEKRLLTYLWELEKTGLNEDAGLRPKELAILRQKVRTRSSKIRSSRIPLVTGWEYVYASLGPIDSGATLSEVINKSKLLPNTVEKILTRLIQLGLVRFDELNQHYVANGLHSVFENYSDDEKNFIGVKLKEAQVALNLRYGNHQNALFQYYFFSINSGSFAKLGQQLKDLLNQYADEAEQEMGEQIAELQVSFLLRE